jgi:hypothetical protein
MTLTEFVEARLAEDHVGGPGGAETRAQPRRLTHDRSQSLDDEAQAPAALAHEVGRAVFGDRCSWPAAERRASEVGASLIITVKAYQAAERLVGTHPGAGRLARRDAAPHRGMALLVPPCVRLAPNELGPS